MLKRILILLGRIGWAQLIYGQRRDEERTLYLARLPLTPMTRWGQLLWHVFYRGDEDPDPHDHPWDFWTRPLFHGYYEEVMDHDGRIHLNLVRPGRWHFRSWAYTHRVMYPDMGIDGMFAMPIKAMADTPEERTRLADWPLHTLVWRKGYNGRTWGFWVLGNNPILDRIGWNIQTNPCTTQTDTDGLASRWRMKVPWRTYLFGEEQKETL